LGFDGIAVCLTQDYPGVRPGQEAQPSQQQASPPTDPAGLTHPAKRSREIKEGSSVKVEPARTQLSIGDNSIHWAI
jgi:hypothetical protein